MMSLDSLVFALIVRRNEAVALKSTIEDEGFKATLREKLEKAFSSPGEEVDGLVHVGTMLSLLPWVNKNLSAGQPKAAGVPMAGDGSRATTGGCDREILEGVDIEFLILYQRYRSPEGIKQPWENTNSLLDAYLEKDAVKELQKASCALFKEFGDKRRAIVKQDEFFDILAEHHEKLGKILREHQMKVDKIKISKVNLVFPMVMSALSEVSRMLFKLAEIGGYEISKHIAGSAER